MNILNAIHKSAWGYRKSNFYSSHLSCFTFSFDLPQKPTINALKSWILSSYFFLAKILRYVTFFDNNLKCTPHHIFSHSPINLSPIIIPSISHPPSSSKELLAQKKIQKKIFILYIKTTRREKKSLRESRIFGHHIKWPFINDMSIKSESI